MIRRLASGLAIAIAVAGGATAETFDIQMLNVGPDGERMVFEPSFLTIAPGDTLRFLATDRGHNAETIEGMIPDGAEAFSGRINEEIEVVLDSEGLYAIRCTPHYAMGMVMIVEVGDVAEVPDGFLEGRIPRGAMERFEAQLGNL